MIIFIEVILKRKMGVFFDARDHTLNLYFTGTLNRIDTFLLQFEILHATDFNINYKNRHI